MCTAGAGPEGSAPVLRRRPDAQSVRETARRTRPPAGRRVRVPHWFYLPAGIVFGLIFVVPTLLSFYFSLTRWTLFTTEFIGLDNFFQFFQEPSLTSGARNTIVYAVVTSGLKVVLGLLLATLLTSRLRSRNLLRSAIFFPVLVSTVAVGITFAVLMHPSTGLFNRSLALFGIDGPQWLATPASPCCRSRSSTSGRASGSRS